MQMFDPVNWNKINLFYIPAAADNYSEFSVCILHFFSLFALRLAVLCKCETTFITIFVIKHDEFIIFVLWQKLDRQILACIYIRSLESFFRQRSINIR